MRTASLIAAVLLLGATSLRAADDEDVALRKFHPWGRFHVGSWAHVRTVTEAIDPDGKVSSTSTIDTRSTLIERGIESFTLKVDTTLEVAGKKIPTQPQSIRLGYADENLGEQLSYCNIEEASVSISGRRIPCSVQEVEIVGSGRRKICQVRYSDRVAPFVLHRKTTQTDLVNPTRGEETEFEVIALDMPFRVCGELRSTAHTKQVQRGPRGSTVTLSVVSADVPGELVSQTAKKLDEKGRLQYRSSLEIVGFHRADAPASIEEDTRDFRIPRRYQKRARHDRR